MNSYKNILVVRTDRIGDVVLTTPTLKALRQTYPDAKITLLVAPLTVDLISKNPHIDDVFIDDRANTHKGVSGFWKLVKEIKSKKFDCAIIFHTKRRTNLLCFCAGIKTRIGYKNNKYGFLLTQPIVDQRHLGEKHESDYCLDVLREMGISNLDTQVHVSLQDEAQTWFNQLVTQKNLNTSGLLAGVHIGASDPSKCWPIEYFAQVIDHIIKQYHAQIILIGTKNQRLLARELIKLVHTPVLDLTGKTSVAQLASLLNRCNILISNDSGPVHIAAGLGTPVVSIFTRNQPGINPERWRPLEPRSQVVSVAPDTEPDFEKAGSASSEYLHNLKPEAVLEAVDAVFKLC